MDLSGLIFVALAVAWAVYLIPKALRHHEDVDRARTVDQFSERMRVLARREPVSAKAARLVVSRTRTEGGHRTTSGAAVVETDAPAPAPVAAPAVEVPRPAQRSAARRRRRVLGGLLVLLAATAVVTATGRLPYVAVAVPAALLVLWLVACRVMVRGEQAARRTPVVDVVAEPAVPDAADDSASKSEAPAEPEAEAETTAERPAVAAGLWDPLPMTLPTYVSKQKATRRTVRTIDLDDSDVWTSGRTEVDAALAREADAERPPVAPEQPGQTRRAVGS